MIRLFSFAKGGDAVARYEHLPIYKTGMELAVLMENAVKTMSRYHKYTIGTDLRNRCLALVSLTARANSSEDKQPVLQEMRIVLEELKQILFLAKEIKALQSFLTYKEAMERVLSLSKQNEGWLRKMRVKS